MFRPLDTAVQTADLYTQATAGKPSALKNIMRRERAETQAHRRAPGKLHMARSKTHSHIQKDGHRGRQRED